MGIMTNSYCGKCGSRITGYTATLRDIGSGTSRTISIWMSPSGLTGCDTGGDHTPSQHPTVAETR